MKKIMYFLILVAVVIMIPLCVHAEEVQAEEVEEPTEAVAPITEPIFGPPAMIVVHRKSNICGVYDANLQLIKAFIVSTGKPGHETPLGTYKIYQHTTGIGYHPMVDGTYGRFCMRFKQGGYMFHSVCYSYPGAPEPIPQEVADIGTSVSRGCVRLNVTDAAWLYNATPNGCLVAILDD